MRNSNCIVQAVYGQLLWQSTSENWKLSYNIQWQSTSENWKLSLPILCPLHRDKVRLWHFKENHNVCLTWTEGSDKTPLDSFNFGGTECGHEEFGVEEGWYVVTSYILTKVILMVIGNITIRNSTEAIGQSLKGGRPGYFDKVVSIPPDLDICCALAAG